MDGIILINKPQGMTSHDVVNRVRRIMHTKKVGHCGTLDPMATGVLVVGINKATKAMQFLMSEEKEYRATLKLGSATDTYDSEGKVLETKPFTGYDHLDEVLSSFKGDSMQKPPMYSAIKINGKKLYEYAREGIEVEVPERPITIYKLDLVNAHDDEITIDVKCSKGTYIRTLCHDIGEKLQVGGCMEELERTKVGHFLKEDAVTLDEVRQKMEQGEGAELFTPLDQIFAELPAVTVTDAKAWMSYNGNDLPERFLLEKEAWTDGQEVRVYDSRKNFIGLYQYRAPKKLFHIKKMFLDPEAEKIEK